MTRTFRFNRKAWAPIVVAKLTGKTGSNLKVSLIFDTGAAMTQFNTAVIDDLGYSAASDGAHMVSAVGPAGPLQTGYAFHLREIEVLGRYFTSPLVAAYDFDNYSDRGTKIGGLLGFDLIKEFHLEMNGAKGELIVFE